MAALGRQFLPHVPAMREEARKKYDDGMLEYIPGDVKEDWRCDSDMSELEEVAPDEIAGERLHLTDSDDDQGDADFASGEGRGREVIGNALSDYYFSESRPLIP